MPKEPMFFTEPERQVSIYALSDETGIRYVGKAISPSKRYAAHIRDCKTRKTPVYNWIGALLKRGSMPEMSILSVVPESQWESEERRLIAHYRGVAGATLLNLADGGDQPSMTRDQRSLSAKVMNDTIEGDLRKKRIRFLKQQIQKSIKAGYVDEACACKLRYAARKAPHIFGAWLNVEATSA